MSSDDIYRCGDAYKALIAQQSSLMGAQAGLDHQEVMRNQRIQSAVYTLTQARSIRADAALMADVRLWVSQQRNELMTLLDDIGEPPK